MNYSGPVIHILGPDLVEITEEPEPYRMSRQDIEEAIANVKARRERYASDVAYLRRLNFFENILTALQAAAQTTTSPLPSQIEDLADHG